MRASVAWTPAQGGRRMDPSLYEAPRANLDRKVVRVANHGFNPFSLRLGDPFLIARAPMGPGH